MPPGPHDAEENYTFVSSIHYPSKEEDEHEGESIEKEKCGVDGRISQLVLQVV